MQGQLRVGDVARSAFLATPVRLGLFVVALTGCAPSASPTPRATVPVAERVGHSGAADASAVDASADAATTPDLAPPDASPDAPPESAAPISKAQKVEPPPGCEASPHMLHLAIVRARVREGGEATVVNGTRTTSIDFAVLDILEWLEPPDPRIYPAFRSSFYVVAVTGFTEGNRHGFGGFGHASRLKRQVGEELLFEVSMPGVAGSEGEALPARFLRRWGTHTPRIEGMCAVADAPKLLEYRRTGLPPRPPADAGTD